MVSSGDCEEIHQNSSQESFENYREATEQTKKEITATQFSMLDATKVAKSMQST